MKSFGVAIGLLLAAVVELLLGNLGFAVPLLLCAVVRVLAKVPLFPALTLAGMAGCIPALLYGSSPLISALIYIGAIGACRALPLSPEERGTTPGELLSGLTAGTIFALGRSLETLAAGGTAAGGVEAALFGVLSGVLAMPLFAWCADLFAALTENPEPEPPPKPQTIHKRRVRRHVSAKEVFRRSRP